MFNINDFNSELNRGGVVKTSLFDVAIFGPNLGTDIERNMKMRCLSTDLPTRDLSTIEYSYYGITKSVISGVTPKDINLGILLSEDFSEKEYFEKWMDKQAGNHRVQNSNPNMWDIGFYEDYIGTIEIQHYSEIMKKTYQTTLIEVFPKAIGPISFNWQSTDFAILPLIFHYKYYKNKTVE